MKQLIRPALAALLALPLFAGCATSKTSPESTNRPAASSEYAEVTQLGSRIPRRVKKSDINRANQEGEAAVGQMAQKQMNLPLPAGDR